MTVKKVIIILSVLFILFVVLVTIAYFVMRPPASTQLPTEVEEGQGILSPEEKRRIMIEILDSNNKKAAEADDSTLDNKKGQAMIDILSKNSTESSDVSDNKEEKRQQMVDILNRSNSN